MLTEEEAFWYYVRWGEGYAFVRDFYGQEAADYYLELETAMRIKKKKESLQDLQSGVR